MKLDLEWRCVVMASITSRRKEQLTYLKKPSHPHIDVYSKHKLILRKLLLIFLSTQNDSEDCRGNQ